MHAVKKRLGRLRGLAVAGATLAVLPWGASPALGAEPVWQIGMTHANEYGSQASECPNGKAEVNGPNGPCGIDPFTEPAPGQSESELGETFARESGWNSYTITVTNGGTAASTGTVTVKDELPQGMVLGGSTLAAEASGTGWTCKVISGAVEAECSRADSLPAGSSYPPITLHVNVKPEAQNPSTNKTSVEGGGASTTSTEDVTKVTEPVPFGIQRFITEVAAPKAGSETCEPLVPNSCMPFGQAGGHPYAASTELAFNYTTTAAEGGHVGPAGGGPKEVQVEVPPGFVGNPQNTPRCPIELLKGPECPANTAVGFTQVVLAPGLPPEGAIKSGKAVPFFTEPPGASTSSLVYSLLPAPGTPAQFGFNVAGGIPFVLDAKLRSDGDYGITVGDSAVGEKPLAVKLTLCANGASREEGVGGELKYSCNPAPASAKPFLTLPTLCTSPEPGKTAAATTTVKANPWIDPEHYVSKTVYTGTGPEVLAGKPSATESLLSGCDELQFHPELEFTPSPASEGGTTTADEPTGVTFNLKSPQSNEAGIRATPELKDLEMTLPAGMTVSPSAADGLQACSDAQFGLGTEFGPGSAHSEPAKPASCPLASQVGTVEVFTPLLSGSPTIDGVPEPPHEGKPGHLLECLPGSWSGSPALSYQWLRDGAPIGEQTDNTYILVEADNGKALQCQVTATNASGSSVAVSRDVVGRIAKPNVPETFVRPPFPPSSIAAPSGMASPGKPLMCANSAWTGGKEVKFEEGKEKEEPFTFNVKFTYRWLRGGVPIAGAEEEKYLLTPEDAGKIIQCQVTGTNEGGEPEGGVIADSAAVVVTPQPSLPPLPGSPVQGQLFVGEPECSPCTEANHDAASGRLLRLFLQVNDPRDGLLVKLTGTTLANEQTGQLTAKFLQQPQQPFELVQVKLKGGARAPLANPQTCGPAVTTGLLTPWSAGGLGGLSGEEQIAGTAPAPVESRYQVEGCPPSAPFSPSFNAGTTGPAAVTAGAFTKFSLTFGREDREQDLSGLEVQLPLGLVGKIAGIAQCGEAEVQAAERNAGECPAASQLGTATAGAGPGPHPFYETGKVYLTGPYKGAPFGLAVVTPAIAGPFNLGNIVVRAQIRIDPNTAAVTTIADPLPQFKDGVQLRIRKVNVEVNRSGFMLNPTNCHAQQVSAKLTSAENARAETSSPFDVGGCAGLPFTPELTAEVGGHGSKANGTSFIVKVKAASGQANIAKTFLQLPIALPSRLDTIQKACRDTTFEANPATCGEGSNIGMAIAHTPLLENPLVGPAYLVSHGNAAFPDVEFVLQGEGITLVLDGKTDIKKGITYSRFETVPDAPVSSFEAILPAGPHSALTTFVPGAEQYNLCHTSLVIPTEITGQNGAVIKKNTRPAITGCATKPSVTIAKVRVKGNALLVTVKASAKGTVKLSGRGLRTTTKRNLAAGSHLIRVPFSKVGRSMRKHRKKTTVHITLTVGKQAVAKAKSVRL